MSSAAADIAPEVRRTRAGTVTHLAPNGSLTSDAAAGALRAAFEDCLNAREIHVVFDLASVPLLNSAALEVFLDCQDEVLRLGGWLKVSHLNAVAKEIFRITGFHDSVAAVEKQDGPEPPLPGRNRKLGDLLIEQGLLTAAQVDEALLLQKKSGKRLGPIVVDKGWVAENEVLRILANQLNIPHVRLRSQLCDPAVVALLDKSVARRLRVVPLFMVRGVLFLATANPQAIPSLDEVGERLGCSVRPVLASLDDLIKSIDEAAPGAEYAADLISIVDDDFEIVDALSRTTTPQIDDMAAGSPVINLVNALIQRASRTAPATSTSRPFARIRIRYRIDGVLYEFQSPRIELHAPHGVAPQGDGEPRHLRAPHAAGRSHPGQHPGAARRPALQLVCRACSVKRSCCACSTSPTPCSTSTSWVSPRQRESLQAAAEPQQRTDPRNRPDRQRQNHEPVRALQHLNSIEKNIVTIEDPVEYQMDIINQNQVRRTSG